MIAIHTADPNSENTFSRQPRGFTLIELVVVIGTIVFFLYVAALLLPIPQREFTCTRRAHCMNNLKQIAVALHLYHDAYHAFPPAYLVDANGKRLHSWRTLILPYVDQNSLYQKIDLSKAWDDPANAESSQAEIPVYRCPETVLSAGHTTYLAIVTPNSCIQPTAPRAFSEITDKHGETLLLIEVDADHAVPWISPMDADEELVLSLGPKSKLADDGEIHAVFVDARVRSLETRMPAAQRLARISIARHD